MLKTHPDKHNSSYHNPHDSHEPHEPHEPNLFHSIQDAYKVNDVVKLLWIAYKYNIDIDVELECCDLYKYMPELDIEIHKCIGTLSRILTISKPL